MSDSERGTGRSQRAVVRALMGAVLGKKVLHVTATQQHGKDLYRYACKFIEDNGLNEHGQVGFTCPVIHIGCGSVYFNMGGSMCTSGLGISLIVEDHHVTEQNAAREERLRLAAEQEADKNIIAKLMRKHQWLTVEAYGPQFHGGNSQKCKVRLNLNIRAPE